MRIGIIIIPQGIFIMRIGNITIPKGIMAIRDDEIAATNIKITTLVIRLSTSDIQLLI